MIRLKVWLALDKESVIEVGEMVAANPDLQSGAIQGQFRYSQSYLEWAEAFPLDPIHLPLSNEIFDANRPTSGIHSVFEDSLPDDWGRRLLVKQHKLPRSEQRPPYLLRCLSGNGLGALKYGEKKDPPVTKDILGSHHLEELQKQANRFEEDTFSVDDELTLLFQAGSSPGGARPKALIQHEGKPYLAKFTSVKDSFDVVALEAAVMELARNAGVETAPTLCLPCGRKKILLVERFDFNVDREKYNHVLTLQTLLGADGYYHLGYRNIADILKKVSSDPKSDLIKLFKQMVFNVLVGNTDDHLKNFSMLYDWNSWSLSPAYDLVPNIGLNKEHVLSINYSYTLPERSSFLKEAKFYDLKHKSKTEGILDAIIEAVENWEGFFRQFDVPQKDMDIIGRDIERRIEKLR